MPKWWAAISTMTTKTKHGKEETMRKYLLRRLVVPP